MDPLKDILTSLNPAQKEAVTWPAAKPLLILAGAGSGKTRILTSRIAWLILHGVRGFNILGVTFTNKAASEMKSRVQKLTNSDVWVSTFHSTCLRILRMDGPRIGLDKNFTIYDDSDQLVIIKEALKELRLDEKEANPKAVREEINRAKDLLLTPAQYAEHSSSLLEENVSKVYKRYEEKLDKLKAVDFGGLISKTVALFDRVPDVLQTWQDRFQHILVDEYQDTNHAQYRLIKLLGQARRQVTVVGDPDQSIYAWRGADIQNILNFEKDYPECGIIRMEQNYRSGPVILEAANEVIKRNTMRKPKALWCDRKDREKITLFEAGDEREEAMFVANSVLRNVQEGKKLADQVVFYRVHAQSRVIEEMLMRANIAYKIVGGTRFYDRKEIKDLIAYMRVLANPNDDISLKRILNVPARGIGKKALETLEEAVRNTQKSLDEVLCNAASLALPPKAQKSLTVFCSVLARLRKRKDEVRVDELLEEILEKTGYMVELETEKTTEAQARIENIQEFYSVISDFYENTEIPKGNSDLETFLESISLVTDLDKLDSGTNVLTLMSMHTAKGLEFPIVYIVGMEEGVFPRVSSYNDTADELEEERRLCYVGITRARNKLHLCYARVRRLYGSMQQNLPSRFLNEIPSELYDTKISNFDSQDDPASDDGIDIDMDVDEIKRRILFD